MSKDEETIREVDPQLSAAYRAGADETAPPGLDRSVLAEAARAVKRDRASAWRNTWYRPVAFAATLGLCLALILQLTDPDIVGRETVTGEPQGSALSGTAAGGMFDEAVNETVEQIRDAEAEANASVMKAPAMSDPAGDTATGEPAQRDRLPDKERCSDEERADAASWWRCIQELEEEGMTRVAEAELQALLKSFPGFAIPE